MDSDDASIRDDVSVTPETEGKPLKDVQHSLMPAEQCLLEQIVHFFSNADNSRKLALLILAKEPVSLRTLDKFVMRFARRNRVYVNDMNGGQVDLYVAYKAALKGYHKHYFDPYARTPPVQYPLPEQGVHIRTTLAQLNFVRWAILHGVIDKCKEYADAYGKDNL
jgi:hypothetical protein